MYQEMLSNITLLDLWSDKDALVAHLEASKENVDSKISEKENEINRAIADDWKNTYTKLQEEQHRRNRNIIEEIVSSCLNFRDEIGKFLVNHNPCSYREKVQTLKR